MGGDGGADWFGDDELGDDWIDDLDTPAEQEPASAGQPPASAAPAPAGARPVVRYLPPRCPRCVAEGLRPRPPRWTGKHGRIGYHRCRDCGLTFKSLEIGGPAQ